VGRILDNSGFIDRLNKQDATGKRSGRQIKNGDILGLKHLYGNSDAEIGRSLFVYQNLLKKTERSDMEMEGLIDYNRIRR
jgi:hypothetical protein